MSFVIIPEDKYHRSCRDFPDKSRKTIRLSPLYDFCQQVENEHGIIGRLSEPNSLKEKHNDKRSIFVG